MADNARDRVSGAELEVLRRKIWLYRSRGMTFTQIAQAVQKSRSACHHHLSAYRRQAVLSTESQGQQEIIGELLLSHRELRQETLRNMAAADQGSLLKLNWIDAAARRIRDEEKFMLDIGLITKTADRVDITVRDVRSMSTEEIEREVNRLREELAYAPTAFLDTTAKVVETEEKVPEVDDEAMNIAL